MIILASCSAKLTLCRVMTESKQLSKQVRNFTVHIASGALSTLMLAGAILLHFPYGYYTLLKIVLFATGGIFATTTNSIARVWMFVAIAIVYNPLLPIRGIQKATWQFINFVTIVVIAIALFHEYKENEKEREEKQQD